MTIITTLMTFVAIGLIFFNVQPVWIQLVAFATSATLFLIMIVRNLPKPQNIRHWFQKKSFLIISLSILVVLNVVARRYDHVFDLSKSKLYSLHSETIEWLKKIHDPVRILIFISSDDKTFAYAEWLQKEIDHHASSIHVEIKSINKEITLAQRYEVKQTGETVLLSGDQWVKVADFKEQSLTQGLMRLLSKSSSVLCFLIGHGEPDIDDPSPEGLGELKKYLSNIGYKIRPVSLLQENTGELSKNCGLLFVMSPRTAFLPQEEEDFQALLQQPLPVFSTLDPPVSQAVTKIFEKKGVSFSKNLVINRTNVSRKIPITDILLNQYGLNPILKNLKLGIYLSQTQSMETRDTETLWSSVLQTPAGDDSFRLLEKEHEDHGALTLAAAGTEKEKPHYVIFGSGRSFLSRHLSFGDNRQLLLNSVRWLLDEEAGKAENILFDSSEKYMDISPKTLFWIKNVSFYFLPGIALLVCSFILIRRYRDL